MKSPRNWIGYALFILSACFGAAPAYSAAPKDEAPPVTVTEDGTSSFTMSNGIVTATISKRNGDIQSLVYKGVETLTDKSGRAGGYWSHDASGGTDHITKILIDPKDNGGERAEVSVKAVSGGHKMGHPAGLPAGAEGDFPADIEIRYAMERGEPGVYTYCLMEHKPEYPTGSIGEARYCVKLAAMYDWLSVDDKRNKYYPQEIPGEDKYVYTAVQSENLAYGWSSTKTKMGWWLVNPTIEYLSGGPTKVEFLCHRDTTAVQAPCVLNYWRSSHYGGAVIDVAQGEEWSKVIGPFFLYMNSLPEKTGAAPESDEQRQTDAIALWKNARAEAAVQAAKWPYEWVDSADYPHKDQRSTVRGTFHLVDPLMPGGARFMGGLTVGLTAPDRMPVAASGAPPRLVTWQTDAKHYEFWAKFADKTGKFAVPNVRPGTYTLRAYADGILGDFAKSDVVVPEGGKPVDLAKVKWAPVRRGKQVWQVGIPNRTAKEFAGGKNFFDPDTQIKYATLFPNDVNFVIGKSDPAKDWYFEQIPHNVDPNAKVVPFRGIQSLPGKATPYTVTFKMGHAPTGTATLRLAFCSASAPGGLQVSVNGQPAGQVDGLNSTGDATIVRHNIQGIWFEKEFPFKASMLKQGTNTLTMTVPAGSLNSGVIYDCVRLELDENATNPPNTAAAN
jgi:rhamnogalacturonan endolyase